jgi:hypothetical protein
MGIKLSKIIWDGNAAQTVAITLIDSIENYDKKRPLYRSSFALRDIKSGQFHSYVTGKAQQAICVFCNKSVASWGKIVKAKRSSGQHIKCGALQNAKINHTPKCYPVWIKSIFYSYAQGKLPPHLESFINSVNERWRRHSDHRWPGCPKCWLDSVYASLPAKPGTVDSINIEILADSFTKINI